MDVPDGTRLAQCIHAAGESSRLAPALPADTRAVALGASGEVALLRLEEKLQAAGIAHAAIREPDAPWDGQLMAIGVAPLQKSPLIRKVMGAFRLV